MKSTLTAAAALLASSAGAVGLAGTAVAAPAPELPLGTGAAQNGVADPMNAATKLVGGVVPASQQLTGKTADNIAHGDLPAVGSLQAIPATKSVLDPVTGKGLPVVGGGGVTGNADSPVGRAMPLSLQGGDNKPVDTIGSAATNPVGTVNGLVGSAPGINALGVN
jgi:hypothetical protein